ncbi:hypothetical protein CGGC5_v016843 [Colletotrichum fructicola Nara gc5]|uniref:Uncharacterized protein n=1 Tax=Colletotrichum fructicola (strain Nara gc5) TaxID=1213859 RepID=A0A7J6IDR9_COLFN|nr:hypothetical protein CGGC5_v016825 [Colletotrichum fructicola Nara gc5]KAF4474489.1 hypothetical protein CGGC5_v016843 [Colletotrichum fructicola Nara gc5]
MHLPIITAALLAALALALPENEDDDNDEQECPRGPAMTMGTVAYFETPRLAEACPEAHVYFLDAQSEVVRSQHVNITNSTTECDTNLLQAISLPADLTSTYAKVTFLCGGDDEPQCQMLRLLPPTVANSSGPSSLAMSRTCVNLDSSAASQTTNPATSPTPSVFPSSPANPASGVADALTSTHPTGGAPTEASQQSAETATGPGGSLPTAAPTDQDGPPSTPGTGGSFVATPDSTTAWLSPVPSSPALPESPSEASSEIASNDTTGAPSSLPAGATDATRTAIGGSSAEPSDGVQSPTDMTTFITSTTAGASGAPRCTCQG